MFQGCIGRFYDLLYEMERLGVLDPSNESHLWCLHLVFIPLVNKHLTLWKNGWIQHPLQTEKNKTPMQLWVQGLNAIFGGASTIAREVFQVMMNLSSPLNSFII